MTNSIRIGVAGAGVFGAYHAEKFAARGDAVVAGVYDIDPARAKALAERCGATPFQDYDKLLQNTDAIIIASPATSHFALAEEALNNRRHLLVEKPLALSRAEADMLVDRAAAAKVVLQVGHQERYVCEAAGLFANNTAPVRIECVRRVRRTGRCEDVSVAFDLMVHDIDIVQRLTKSNICSVRAEGDENEITAELLLENGTFVSIVAGRRAYEPERRMAIVYEDRVLEFDFINRVLTDLTAQRQIADFGSEDGPLALHDPLAHSASLFIDAIRGEPGAYVTGLDGRICVDWAGKIEAAAGFSVLEAHNIHERLRA